MAYLINSPQHFITSDYKTERPYTCMMQDCKGIVSRLSLVIITTLFGSFRLSS